MSLKDEIKAIARESGANLFGVAEVKPYTKFLEEIKDRVKDTGAAANDYMLSEPVESFFSKISDARNTLPGAKSIIILGVYSFDQNSDYRTTRQALRGKTARTYAYYPVIRKIGENVADCIKRSGYQVVQGQHIPLKYVADEIGLGKYGWNGLLLTKEYGSFVALRSIITDAQLEPDQFEPPQTQCEDCGRCLKACPTKALYAPYKINPKLCINPLSRKPDRIPEELQKKMGNWICGCDICQDVCPANQHLKPREVDPRSEFDAVHHDSHRTLKGLTKCPDLKDLLLSGEHAENRRNAAIALGNIGTQKAADILEMAKNTKEESLREYVLHSLSRV